MGNSCVTGKNKNTKSKKNGDKKNQIEKEQMDSSINMVDMKKQADIISFQHKFPTIRPLLNNDLYKSRVQQQRKNTLESISNEQLGFPPKKFSYQQTNSLSQVSTNFQATRAVI